MRTDSTAFRALATFAALAVLALITAAGKALVGLNATTVALLYLLVVLAAAAFADFLGGLVTAVVSGLLVDYCFLPPFGTLHVDAPEDWVSLAAYALTAAIVSHFAATVRRRAVEADRLRAELARLGTFARALAESQPADLTPEAVAGVLRRAYGLDRCAVHLFAEGVGKTPGMETQVTDKEHVTKQSMLERIAESGSDVRCLALTDRGEPLGAVVLCGQDPPAETGEAVAALTTVVVRQRQAARPGR